MSVRCRTEPKAFAQKVFGSNMEKTMSTEKGFDFEHPIHFVERKKLLQTAAVAAVGVLPVSAASVPKK